ncbi:MAG: hypothetical protein LBR51_02085 [Bacteroidales bacterium]|jgi:hypothetical protein|nr:hypothetical protein [Bacteroidales bacterium]
MKKKYISLILCLSGFLLTSVAQNPVTDPLMPETKKTREKTKTTKNVEIIRDRMMFDFFHVFWLHAPAELNIQKKFHPGCNFSLMWDFKKPGQSVSFGLGVGVTYYTQFSNGRLLQSSEDGVMRYYLLQTDSFSLNRLNMVSCNIPLEFRYRHRSGFKFSIGARLGLIAELSQSYKGQDLEQTGKSLYLRDFKLENKMSYHFDVYARIGWKYVSVYYGYQITSLFEKDKGPLAIPMSLGVTWNIF